MWRFCMKLAMKVALSVVALALTTNTAIAQIDTTNGQAFLSSIAEKFGVSEARLQSLLDKIPPRGPGLSSLEISVIAGKLGLDKSGKEVLKARVGKGGTGFTSEDVMGMGEKLGLDST